MREEEGLYLLGLSWCLHMIVQHVLQLQTLEGVEPYSHGVLTFKAPSSSCISMYNIRFLWKKDYRARKQEYLKENFLKSM